MSGRDVYGKKHPAFIISFPSILSYEPIMLTFPSGSIKKDMDGECISEADVGIASITPPCLQNAVMYSYQF